MGNFDVARRQITKSLPAHQRKVDRHRQRAQRMIGADIRGGPLAPDMLLTSRKRQAEASIAAIVVRRANQTARKLAHVRDPRRHEADARPPELNRQPEALRFADGDISVEIAGRLKQAERKRLFMLNVNQWINEIGRQATEQLKIAILKDGMEAQVAENQHARLSEQADAIERAKNDTTVVNWAISR